MLCMVYERFFGDRLLVLHLIEELETH